MYGKQELRVAQALVAFNAAYKELVNAAEVCEDLDLSENYPFFLLDFQTIAGDVEAWCATNCNKIVQRVDPDVLEALNRGVTLKEIK